VQFSRDPLNLTNKHSRKHAGFVNEKAIGIHPDSNTVRSIHPTHHLSLLLTCFKISMTTKLSNRQNKPAKSTQQSSFSASTPSRKLYRSVVGSTAKKGYRPDLRQDAVARASAVKLSQREKKETPAPKLRGAKARKAEETS
jgi:large subunit ribosomal protein L28e